jgi:hypothetical protein
MSMAPPQIQARLDTTPVIDFTDSGIGIAGSQSGAVSGTP